MQVSKKIKEDIRKTQTELKNAIRVYQVWMSQLQEDENNYLYKSKVKEAEKVILTVGRTQNKVVDKLRRELELYQQRLKARNRQVNVENDYKYIAQQLRDHQIQFKNINKLSVLKPNILNNIHNDDDDDDDLKPNSDSDNEYDIKPTEKDSNSSENENKETQDFLTVADSRRNFTNALIKVRDTLLESARVPEEVPWMGRIPSECSSPGGEISPSPPPPQLPAPGETITQEFFLSLIGLVTHRQKELLNKKRQERRKRRAKSEFPYENFDMVTKRKKSNQYPYLQSHSGPPQTRSAKLRKQKKQNDKSSREGSPSGSAENKWWNSPCKPDWHMALPEGLTVVPVFPESRKACHTCGRQDVPSLLVWCGSCCVMQHTGCGEGGRCGGCGDLLPDPALFTHAHRDKIVHRKELQERNVQLCLEVEKLLARADILKENLDEKQEEKRKLLTDQIKTQQDLQKLLDFINQFRETLVSTHSTSISESGSEMSKSNE